MVTSVAKWLSKLFILNDARVTDKDIGKFVLALEDGDQEEEETQEHPSMFIMVPLGHGRWSSCSVCFVKT